MKLTNPYHFTHTDLDGYGCAVLLQRAGITTPERTKFVSYNDLKTEIVNVPKESAIIITDLSANQQVMRMFSRFKHVVYLDHHTTTEWIAQTRANDPKMDIIVDTEYCATSITARWLKRRGIRVEERFVKLVNDHDLWKNEMPDSDRLNILTSLKGQDFVPYMVNMDVEDALKRNAEDIDRKLEERADYVANTKAIVSDDNKQCVAFAEKYQSYVGDYWIKQGYDPVFIINLRCARVSVRTKNINAAKLCQQNGGGGHVCAAGFPMNDYMVEAMSKAFMESVRGKAVPILEE